MRRAGRPELEHRQVRTEFEHQRCELRLAMGGEAVRDAPHETYYCQLKSHDPLGESKPFGLLLLLPLVIAPAGAPAPFAPIGAHAPALQPVAFRWNVALHTCRCSSSVPLERRTPLPPVATPTPPSPKRPSGSRPTRTTPSRPRSRPGPTASPGSSEAGTLSPSLSDRARLLVIYYLFSSLSYDALAPSPQ